jgi:hypothetical protein
MARLLPRLTAQARLPDRADRPPVDAPALCRPRLNRNVPADRRTALGRSPGSARRVAPGCSARRLQSEAPGRVFDAMLAGWRDQQLRRNLRATPCTVGWS